MFLLEFSIFSQRYFRGTFWKPCFFMMFFRNTCKVVTVKKLEYRSHEKYFLRCNTNDFKKCFNVTPLAKFDIVYLHDFYGIFCNFICHRKRTLEFIWSVMFFGFTKRRFLSNLTLKEKTCVAQTMFSKG